jgi:hypothetical protein
VASSVFLQELLRRDAQSVLQTQDVVWREKLIQIATTTIEARNAWMASEPKGVMWAKLLNIFHNT